MYGESYGVDLFREGEWTVAQVRLRCMTLEEYEENAKKADPGEPPGNQEISR